MSTMRIAVAGTCGLALIIAREIHEQTSHQLLILSRSHQPGLISQGYQCQVVDYNDTNSIQHSLMGVDTVISTVTGNAQLRLIEAAVQCRVRRFAPAEFEGQPGLRIQSDPLDRGKAAALALLHNYRAYIQFTVFVCGILYERFSVDGMVSHRIGTNTGYGNEGDYILDARNMTSEAAPVYDSAGNLAYLCMISAYDLGRFVVRALDMPQWPAELSMCGERMSVNQLIETVKTCRGKLLNNVGWQNPEGLRYQLSLAQMEGDVRRQRRLFTLIATAEGRYDFANPAYLNTQFPDIRPMSFRDWFTRNWASVP
ncbi:NAD(P)-binding protein [Lindgomyces ingoldianus]|uniref:NAD(P)-binding protein n=1 Tax=Lindgomyces ingoldianus TaxID=673940 RepID=A0ACB6QT66_9PLEO|nr:NAD(P)-binding protein [Lindgomyces ingoldianus]KAF2470189.1 NAD(P)-binding protein [Lindgomyces ingoldianus]